MNGQRFVPAGGTDSSSQPVIVEAIDAAIAGGCACDCQQPLAADGVSAWFATAACQRRWNAARTDRPNEVLARPDAMPGYGLTLARWTPPDIAAARSAAARRERLAIRTASRVGEPAALDLTDLHLVFAAAARAVEAVAAQIVPVVNAVAAELSRRMEAFNAVVRFDDRVIPVHDIRRFTPHQIATLETLRSRGTGPTIPPPTARRTH